MTDATMRWRGTNPASVFCWSTDAGAFRGRPADAAASLDPDRGPGPTGGARPSGAGRGRVRTVWWGPRCDLIPYARGDLTTTADQARHEHLAPCDPLPTALQDLSR
jgi:hypothetical protein